MEFSFYKRRLVRIAAEGEKEEFHVVLLDQMQSVMKKARNHFISAPRSRFQT